MANIPMFALVQEHLAAVETELQSVIHSPVELINDIGHHLIQAGGKRLRPALYLLCAHSGVQNFHGLLPLAVAIELIHMATLVHDDVIDVAATRRGKPTANVRWGNHASVLTGDYLFARSFAIVAANTRNDMLKLLTDIICSMCEGEIIQGKEAYKLDLTEDEYLRRIAKKTADLIAVSCQLGGMSANLPEAQVQALYQYGYDLGMAFQITDDILDVTASSEQVGKPVGHDLRQGIITLPVLYALRHSPQAQELEMIIAERRMTDDNVNRALDIVHQTEAVEYSYRKVYEYLEHARNIIPAALNEEVRQALTQIADFIGLRKF